MITWLILSCLAIATALAIVTRGRVVILGGALMLSGCGATLTDATVATNAATVLTDSIRDQLESIQVAQQDAAIKASATEADAVVRLEKVRDNWVQIWAAFDDARAALVAVHATVQALIALDAAGHSPSQAEVEAALRAVAMAVSELTTLVRRVSS